ncbi:MAG: competence/damage-inducible protein A [Myxococcales bacterium]
MSRTAAAIIIGNEVLSGKVVEANGAYLIRVLREHGIELKRIVTVQDDIDAIVETIGALRFKVDLLITSGGLGPTHDDLTVRAVALALGRPVVVDEEMAEKVRRHYGPRFTPEALRLANAPQGAQFVKIPDVWMPVLTVENVVLLPGVPELFRLQLDAIAPQYASAPFHLRCVFLSESETAIAAALDRVALAFADVAIGSYPRFDTADHKVKITLEARAGERVEAALQALLGALPPSAIVRVE